MRIQFWSYNYLPEPQGIAPLTAVVAEELAARGNDVSVIAAHPHYPSPLWGSRLRPYRQRHNGVSIYRLPIWAGRRTSLERVRQELSFLGAVSAIAPLLPGADCLIAVTPSFPALAVAMAHTRVRRTPWAIWLQDILPDGAATTGLVEPGPLLEIARRFETAAYADSDRVIVISEVFRQNLLAKGVAPEKLTRIYNPAKAIWSDIPERASQQHPATALIMGNIGHSQGLEEVVRAFEADEELERQRVRLVVAGDGVAADAVKATITSDRVEMPGVVMGADLDALLARATLGVVTQRPDVAEFNLPSKLMHYMGVGLPVVGVVRPGSETERIIHEANAGWTVDASDPAAFPGLLQTLLANPQDVHRASRNSHAYALEHFSARRVTDAFEDMFASIRD